MGVSFRSFRGIPAVAGASPVSRLRPTPPHPVRAHLYQLWELVCLPQSSDTLRRIQIQLFRLGALKGASPNGVRQIGEHHDAQINNNTRVGSPYRVADEIGTPVQHAPSQIFAIAPFVRESRPQSQRRWIYRLISEPPERLVRNYSSQGNS